MDEFTIRLDSIGIPDAGSESEWAKAAAQIIGLNTLIGKFAVTGNGTTFVVPVKIPRTVDDADYVPFARHHLHAFFAKLAEQTAHWTLSSEWIAERQPPQPADDELPF